MRHTAAEGVANRFTHVAVAAIVNGRQQVLVSLRPDHVHQGGLWEFPGGKLEPGESVPAALHREIHEELGIRVTGARPLIRIPHRYPDEAVLLDVWKVETFEGVPHGKEGQVVEWLPIDALAARAFPAANLPIIHALQLPAEYLITPEPSAAAERFLRQLRFSLEAGVRLVQLRAKALNREAYETLARQAIELCRCYQARILLNSEPQLVQRLGADGVHLNATRLAGTRQRPLADGLWVAASCHGPDDLARAESIGADFAVLSPIKATASHPAVHPLGWTRFCAWVDDCAIPVYALGGMDRSDIGAALQNGAQGIAGIRALWGKR